LAINFARNTGMVEKRRAPRAPLGIEALMRERGRSAVSVKVLTFSAYGCRIADFIPAARDGQAWLKLPGLESRAVSTIWSDDTCLGVEFEHPLHPSVAARYLPAPGSHAAIHAASPPAANDHLLSRREQIMAGVVASDLSPLQRNKAPNGLGLSGKITRTKLRNVDHRAERRHGGNLEGGPSQVVISGVAGSVRNVSPSGLRAFMPQVLDCDIGQKVDVAFAGFDAIRGRIVWMNQTEVGLSLPPQTIELFDAG